MGNKYKKNHIIKTKVIDIHTRKTHSNTNKMKVK